MLRRASCRFLVPFAVLALAPLTGLAQTSTFDLPAQPLAESLKAVGAQTGINIMVSPPLVDGKQAPPLKANLSVNEALAHLLTRTKLEYHFVNEQTVVIREKSAGAVGDPPPAQPSAPNSQGTKEAGKNSSQDFRVAQATSGSNQGAVSVGTTAASATQSTQREALEEIVVTAQKRQERLLDAPQSVTVLTGDELARTGATQLRDFADTVPGMSLTSAGTGYTQITLRGVTTGFDLGSTVAIYVDDVPYGSSSPFADGPRATLDTGLFDLERIEVLRGPQGTLYGASTMGGLLKYVTKRPDSYNWGGTVETGVSATGDGGGVNFVTSGSVNMPLSPGAAGLRASAFESHDGGYIDNVALNEKDVNRSNVYGGRLDLMLTPSDALSFRLVGFLQNISRAGEGTADYTFAGAQPYGPLGQYRLLNEPFDQHFKLISGTIDYDMPWAGFTSISSYQTMSSTFSGDVTPGYVSYCGYVGFTCSALGYAQQTSTDKFTQELRLTSKQNQFLEWIAGGFYTHERSDLAQQYLPFVAGAPSTFNLFTYDAPSGYQEYAAFGDVTWHLSAKFDVAGGLRWASSETRKSQIGTGSFGLSHPEVSSNDHVFTYLGNIRYHVSDQATAYLRYATGYRPGGPNLVTENPATGQLNGAATFRADSLRSYEAGFKADTTDRRFGIDLSIYYIDWKNIQVTVTQGGFSTIENASGGADIRGAELAINAIPIKGLKVALATAYQDAKLKDAEPALGAFKGEALPNVPKFSGSLTADYELPLADLSWRPSVGATVRSASSRDASFDADASFPQYHMPSYTMLDIRSGAQWNALDVELFVRNLLDRRAQLSTYTWKGSPEVAISQPRTVGVQLNYHF